METFDPGFRVLFLGERMAAIDKPSGLLSVPGKGPGKEDCAVSRVRAMCAARGLRCEGPLVVHRLDMDTSGVMVFGLDAGAQRELGRQFEAREVEKKYVALVEGIVERDAGVIDAAIRLEPGARPFRVFDAAPGRGQRAVTRWRVLAREVDRTRVEFMPETGRTHQLRVHAALPAPVGLGHAIVGDVLYGAEGQAVFRGLMEKTFTAETRRRGEEIGEVEGRDGGEEGSEAGSPHPALSHEARERGREVTRESCERLMLHACWLRVRDPGTGRWVEIESAAPF